MSVDGLRIFSFGALTKRIVALMILVSALLSAVASGLQLYLSYERNRANIVKQFEVVHQSFDVGLTNALWFFNFEQVELLLNSALSQPDIKYARIDTPSGHTFVVGNKDDKTLLVDRIPLVRNGPGAVEVGTLEMGVSLLAAREGLFYQFLEILLTNFGKAIIGGTAMLLIFERLVGRHLVSIASYLDTSAIAGERADLALDRPKPARPDELDAIVAALSAAQTENARMMGKLTSEIGVRLKAEDRLLRRSEDLAIMNTELTQTNQEQKEFAYAVSHDLKSPSNTLAMILNEVSEQYGKDLPEDVQFLLTNAEQTNARMRELIEDVLNYSQMIDPVHRHERIVTDELVSSVLKDIDGEIRQSGATIHRTPLPDFFGDPFQISMLFRNLLSNAVKFRKPNTKPIIHISGSQDPGANTVTFVVSDNGIGIDAQFRETVFRLFERLHNHRDYPGTGLGLSLCKRVATNHRGQISVASDPGEGATFSVTLDSGGGREDASIAEAPAEATG